jgi:hypothetical protein
VEDGVVGVTNDVRVEIYRSFVEDGRAPSFEELAHNVGAPEADIRDAVRKLDSQDVIALQKGRVWLAHPFCADACAFTVTSGSSTWDAICIWDALGILGLLHRDGRVETTCPDCDEPLTVEIQDGAVSGPRTTMIHFGVPASRWYDDVAYT